MAAPSPHTLAQIHVSNDLIIRLLHIPISISISIHSHSYNNYILNQSSSQLDILEMNPPDQTPLPSPLMSLPTELHLLILNLLLFPDLIHLKLTCTYFHTLIHPLNHPALLDAEITDFAAMNDIFACRYCLRLRPRAEFADRMLHRRRGRYGRDAEKRFCVDCGLKPRVGRPRYGPGALIVVKGVSYVICLSCRELRLGVKGRDGKMVMAECRDCLGKRQWGEREREVELVNEKVKNAVLVNSVKGVYW